MRNKFTIFEKEWTLQRDRRARQLDIVNLDKLTDPHSGGEADTRTL